MPSENRLAASPGFNVDDACAIDPTVIDDFLFLYAWERGLIPVLSAFLRVRQIRRAKATARSDLQSLGGPTEISTLDAADRGD